MDLTISIVSYNTNVLLKRCITSIYRYTKGVNFEIIVADNASTDGTVSMIKKEFPKVKVIANKQNAFFAKANNQAIKIAKGKYVLILNADTYLVDNSFKKMFEFMENHPDVGACDGLEHYEDGRVLDTGSKFTTPLIDFYALSLIGKRVENKQLMNAYRLTGKDRKKTFEIDVGCDAFLMVRSEILKNINGYDENLLLFYTENDLCLRIKQVGFKIYHFGESKIMHAVSASTNKLGWKKMDIYYRDLLTYYKKNGYAFTGTSLFYLLTCEKILLQIREKITYYGIF